MPHMRLPRYHHNYRHQHRHRHRHQHKCTGGDCVQRLLRALAWGLLTGGLQVLAGAQTRVQPSQVRNWTQVSPNAVLPLLNRVQGQGQGTVISLTQVNIPATALQGWSQALSGVFVEAHLAYPTVLVLGQHGQATQPLWFISPSQCFYGYNLLTGIPLPPCVPSTKFP